ncbi:hypothetical protein ACFE04_009788 [Oxalis oulophora]
MAGIATSFHFNTLIAKPTNISSSSRTLSLSSLQSNLLFNLNFSLSSFTNSGRCTTISARYGGGGGDTGGGGRGGPRSTPELDEALDISSIRSSTVRLIDQQQNMVGVVPKSTAIQMAEDANLDLVILSPEAEPPVVRIMDYSKYRYEQAKRKKTQQKKGGAIRVSLKELKMGYNIDQHDYDVRLRAAKKFLKEGDKVKVIVNLKGRENEFRNIAIALLRRFQTDVGELATEESKNFSQRNIFLTLVPNKALLQKP